MVSETKYQTFVRYTNQKHIPKSGNKVLCCVQNTVYSNTILLQFTTIYYNFAKTVFFEKKLDTTFFETISQVKFLRPRNTSLEPFSRILEFSDHIGFSLYFTTIYYNLLQSTTISGAGAVKKCAGSKIFPKIIFSMIIWWTLPICRSPECLELFLRPRRRPSAKSGCPGRLPPGPGGSQEASPIKSNNL